ncbi:hypothetical protein KXD40_006868 [Peronospora effusa]|nr:hypothetical protein KXD40_006868 [Peronospora effusa]
MMKISVLAIAAAIAIVNVSAADQPVLRSEATSAEAVPGTMTTPDKNKKEHFWGGGPWGGLGWRGGWDGCCGGFGWGRGFGWGCVIASEVLADFTRKKISYLRHEST